MLQPKKIERLRRSIFFVATACAIWQQETTRSSCDDIKVVGCQSKKILSATLKFEQNLSSNITSTPLFGNLSSTTWTSLSNC